MIMYAKTTLTALAVLLASTAFAGTESTKMGTTATLPSFSTLDANHDGYVSKTEAQSSQAVVAQWSSLDADQNGQLSSAEYAKAAGSSTNTDDTSQE
jgi:hypothetical protein